MFWMAELTVWAGCLCSGHVLFSGSMNCSLLSYLRACHYKHGWWIFMGLLSWRPVITCIVYEISFFDMKAGHHDKQGWW